MSEPTLHGWYSAAATKAGVGTHIYATPDGGRVEISFVNQSRDDSMTKWEDVRYVGPVTRWLRVGVEPTGVFRREWMR